MANPLRYNISNWFQLTECKSNTSADLYITVKQVIDDGSHRLTGIVIQVQHNQYGTLFACMVNADGTGLRPIYRETEYDWVTHEAVISADELAFAIIGLLMCQYTFLSAIEYSNSATATVLPTA